MSLDPPSRRARAARRLASGTVSMLVTLLLAEGAFRLGGFSPRGQIVRHDAEGVEIVDEDVPLWRQRGSDLVENADCPHDGSTDVAFVGDSIFRTTTPGEAEGVLSLRVARALDGRPDVCVLNVSQSGYLPYQQLEEARRLHAAVGLDLMVFVVWKAGEHYTRIGDDWYNLGILERTASGLPVPPLPLPEGLHRALLTRSALWEYATLALAPVDETARIDLSIYEEAATWAAEAGVDALFLEFPALSRPFAQTVALREANREHREDGDVPLHLRTKLERHVRDLGLGYLVVAEILAARDEDVEALRLDTCCHYADPGQAVLAEIVTPLVEARLDALSPGP